MSKGVVRYAKINDLDELTAIYNEAISEKAYTCHTTQFTSDERKEWFYEHSDNEYPMLVFELEHEVVAYATRSKFRGGREALSKNTEISYYVKREFRKMGIGSILISNILEKARKIGFINVIAIIIGNNAGSVAVLKNFKFTKCGSLENAVNFEEFSTSLDLYNLKIN